LEYNKERRGDLIFSCFFHTMSSKFFPLNTMKKAKKTAVMVVAILAVVAVVGVTFLPFLPLLLPAVGNS